jgi:hypothetical protein
MMGSSFEVGICGQLTRFFFYKVYNNICLNCRKGSLCHIGFMELTHANAISF